MNNGTELNVRSSEKSGARVGQEQIHGLLFGNELSWHSIIYDLINSEQLDPWDIDICLLSNKYLETVRKLEEANFFVSSKVLLAASLLLRIKSEILLNHYIPSLDDILYGKKEEKHYVQERIELDDDIPGLIPRTPLPRGRRVTLQELIAALGKAITTENRRIKRVVNDRQREFETSTVIPRRKIDLQKQINLLYGKLKSTLDEKNAEKVTYSSFGGESNQEKVSNFLPLLHLDYQSKVLAEQEGHFEEIWVWLKHVYEKKHASILEEMRREVEQGMKEDNKKEFEKRKEVKEKSRDEIEKAEEMERENKRVRRSKGKELKETDNFEEIKVEEVVEQEKIE